MATLTTQQKATLLADITAKSAVGQPIRTQVLAGDWDGVAVYYNGLTASTAWRTEAPVFDVLDAIDWTKYTPADAIDSTALFTNRTLVIQTKQMNLQSIVLNRTTLDFSKSNVRAGLRDAVISLPAGASGALISAAGSGGSILLTAGTRVMRVVEVLFASAPVATGPVSAAVMGYEGSLSAQTISDVMGGL